MTLNLDELNKIKYKTSGVANAKARSEISNTIRLYEPKIRLALSFKGTEKIQALISLMNEATANRHLALQNGASSFEDPSWAAAATIESWLHELLGADKDSIRDVEALIIELRDRC